MMASFNFIGFSHWGSLGSGHSIIGTKHTFEIIMYNSGCKFDTSNEDFSRVFNWAQLEVIWVVINALYL